MYLDGEILQQPSLQEKWPAGKMANSRRAMGQWQDKAGEKEKKEEKEKKMDKEKQKELEKEKEQEKEQGI